MSDDKIAEIRARHEAGPIGHLPIAAFSLADDDRATLLVEVDRLRAEVERLREQNKLFRNALAFVAAYRRLPDPQKNPAAFHMSAVAQEALEAKP